LLVKPLDIGVPRDSAVIIEFDPFGWAIEAIADRDVEVGHLPVVEDIPSWCLIESVLIVEDVLLKGVDSLLVPFDGDGGVGFMVGDSLEEPVHNLVEETGVDVVVVLEGGGDCMG
jgi:hypothetical protein